MALSPPAPTPEPDPPEQPGLVDELTVERARRGDRQAFRRLVEAHERPVFALLSRMVSSGRGRTLVEDLAQETFLRVHAALPGFGADGRKRLGAWILTIAARLAIDELRRLHPEVEPLDEGALASPVRADEHLERMELRARLGRALESLQPEFRAAFLLYEVHGLAYEEVAEAMAVDLGTVKSRLARARQALRRALGDER